MDIDPNDDDHMSGPPTPPRAVTPSPPRPPAVEYIKLRVPKASEVLGIIRNRHAKTRLHAPEKVLYAELAKEYHGISRIVCKAVILRCPVCAASAKAAAVKTRSIRGIYSVKYGERQQMDLFDLQATPGGKDRDYKYVFHYVDHFTKFSTLVPIKDKQAATIAYHLREIWSTMGPPELLQSDNGTEFKNNLVADVCLDFNVHHVFGTAYHPQTQGVVERANQFAKKKLAAWFASQPPGADWVPILHLVQMELNTTVRTGTRMSPYELVFNRPFRLTPEIRRANVNATMVTLFDSDSDSEVNAALSAAHEVNAQSHEAMVAAAAATSTDATTAMVNRHNAQASKVTFKPDDLVMVKLVRKRERFSAIDLPRVPMIVILSNVTNGTARVYGVHGILGDPVAFADMNAAPEEARVDGLFIKAREINAEWTAAKLDGPVALKKKVLTADEMISRYTKAIQEPSELNSSQKMQLNLAKAKSRRRAQVTNVTDVTDDTLAGVEVVPLSRESIVPSQVTSTKGAKQRGEKRDRQIATGESETKGTKRNKDAK